MNDDEGRRLTAPDGTGIAWTAAGDGPVLVIVTGALADRTTSAGFVATFGATHRVVTYDRRGRGASDAPPSWTLAGEVADLAAVIDANGGSASVLGISSGAVLALHAAAAGIGVSAVLAWEPPFDTAPGAGERIASYRSRLDALLAGDRRAEAVELFLTDRAGLPADMVGGMRAMPMWPLLEANAPSLRGDAAVMGEMTVPAEVLARITVPAIVADGGQSPWLSAGAEAAAVGHVQHRRVAGQGHDPDPGALAPLLAELGCPAGM